MLKPENLPKTQEEKDIWNLKYMLYNIQRYSRFYRHGVIKTLKRTIKILEKKLKYNKNKLKAKDNFFIPPM